MVDTISATPIHQKVKETYQRLMSAVIDLPAIGALYLAIHPVWSVFIACVAASNNEDRFRLAKLLHMIHINNKGVNKIQDLWYLDQSNFCRTWALFT